MFPLCTQHHIADSHCSLADMPHFLHFRASLLSALSLVVSKLVESCFSRNPPTYTHHDDCTLLNSMGGGGGGGHITSLNPTFDGSHFSLPHGSIHRMVGWVVAVSRIL